MFKNDDSDIEIQAVKRTIRKNKNLRLHKRYMVILHYLKGYQNCEIAEMEFLCGHTVGNYINKYKKYGLYGLTLGHSTGTPRLLNTEQKK